MGLKTDLDEYFREIRHDFDKEEIDNVLEILSEEDEDLNGLSKINMLILNRLIDDDELSDRVFEMYEEPLNEDPFA